jgi:hypothetical protein
VDWWSRRAGCWSSTSNPTATYLSVLYKASEKSIHYVFSLKVTSSVFAETLDKFQHLMWLIPESQTPTVKKKR